MGVDDLINMQNDAMNNKAVNTLLKGKDGKSQAKSPKKQERSPKNSTSNQPNSTSDKGAGSLPLVPESPPPKEQRICGRKRLLNLPNWQVKGKKTNTPRVKTDLFRRK